MLRRILKMLRIKYAGSVLIGTPKPVDTAAQPTNSSSSLKYGTLHGGWGGRGVGEGVGLNVGVGTVSDVFDWMYTIEL